MGEMYEGCGVLLSWAGMNSDEFPAAEFAYTRVGTDPQCAVFVAVNGNHRIVNQPIGFGEGVESPIFKSYNSGSVGTDPESALFVFIQHSDAFGREPVVHAVRGETALRLVHQAAIGGADPQRAGMIHAKSRDFIVG